MVRWIRAPYVVNRTANTPFELFYSGCGVSCYSQRCEHFKCSLAEYLVFQERDNALRTNRNTEDGTDGRKEEVVSARESIGDSDNNVQSHLLLDGGVSVLRVSGFQFFLCL